MSELNFTPDSIRDLIELVSEKHLSSFKIEQGDFKLEIQGEQRQATPVPAAVGAAVSYTHLPRCPQKRVWPRRSPGYHQRTHTLGGRRETAQRAPCPCQGTGTPAH